MRDVKKLGIIVCLGITIFVSIIIHYNRTTSSSSDNPLSDSSDKTKLDDLKADLFVFDFKGEPGKTVGNIFSWSAIFYLLWMTFIWVWIVWNWDGIKNGFSWNGFKNIFKRQRNRRRSDETIEMEVNRSGNQLDATFNTTLLNPPPFPYYK